jgi:hypothetical protein
MALLVVTGIAQSDTWAPWCRLVIFCEQAVCGEQPRLASLLEAR